MIKRLAVLAAASTMTVGIFVTSGAAPAGATVFEVGGGASGVMIQKTLEGQAWETFGPIFFPQAFQQGWTGVRVTDTNPAVTLPRDGSAKEIAATTVGGFLAGVTFGAPRVTTIGTTAGTPYAESSAQVVQLKIPGVDISAISTHCRWDTNGAVADTVITRLNGTEFVPVPGLEIPVPGLGVLRLNHVVHSTWEGASVIAVTGAELFHPKDQYGYTQDLTLAFSSCDPLNLPILSGIHLLGGG